MATIGLVFPGNGAMATVRSGVPFSVGRGLEEAGAAVRHLRADLGSLDRAALGALTAIELPRALAYGSVGETRRRAFNGPLMGAVQSWAGKRRLRRANGLDGIVQIGSSYCLSGAGRIITHDDMTVVQAARARYPGIVALSRRQLARRIERQRQAYERADACCTVTRWAAQSLIDDYGISPEKVHVVGGGRNHEPRAAQRDWSRPRFLLVAKDWDRKNGPAVVRAFERLKRQIDDATLDVVGYHPPLSAPGVTGHGPRRLDDPADRTLVDQLFETATCYVMPSRHEPSGIVFSEANAAGIPSIGTTEGGSGELIGNAGRVVHPDDDDGLLDAMRTLADPATAERLGHRARTRSGLFTWRAVGERLLRALQIPGHDHRLLSDFL